MSVAVARPAAEADGPRIGEISFRSHTISYRGFARASFIEAQGASEHTGYWSGLLLEASGEESVSSSDVAVLGKYQSQPERIGSAFLVTTVAAHGHVAEEGAGIGEKTFG